MAVVEYLETSRSGSIDEQGYRTYTREFLVTSNDPTDGALEIAAGVPVPFYSRYNCGGGEVDLWARCKRQEATRVPGELLLWKFVANYDSKPFDRGTGGTSGLTPGSGQEPTPPSAQAPNLRPWMIRFGAVSKEETITTDFSDPPKKILASNGQPFDGLTRTTHIPEFTITAWTSTPEFDKVRLFTNKVNETVFMGYPVGSLLCTNYQIQSVWEQNAYFYQRDVTFQIASDTWNAKVLDAGTYEIISATKRTEPILDSAGNPVTSPVPLNGNGAKLLAANPPVYLEFKIYKGENFTSIIS